MTTETILGTKEVAAKLKTEPRYLRMMLRKIQRQSSVSFRLACVESEAFAHGHQLMPVRQWLLRCFLGSNGVSFRPFVNQNGSFVAGQ